MNYKEAVLRYGTDSTAENLEQQISGLLCGMTLKEKVGMLHGKWFIPQVLKT
jgi:hypothetical protein